MKQNTLSNTLSSHITAKLHRINFQNNKLNKLCLVCFIFNFSFLSCSFAQGTWTQKADFGGTARYLATAFSIGNKGYIGTGYDGSYRKDFWEWDCATNVWTQKADFGGTARWEPVGFSIGIKGYIGTGFDGVYKQDFWEWDQAANSWTQKQNFPGAARSTAVGFSIGTKGYIGTGNIPVPPYKTLDFWEWDQSTDTWTQIADFGGTARYFATGFSMGTKGYVGTGYDGAYKKDIWEWDQASNTWTQKADFGGTQRYSAVGFSIGAKGYIGTGYNSDINTLFQDFWEWDQASNSWIQRANFGGTAREYAVGFSIGNCGYIGTGNASDAAYKKDFWAWNDTGACCTVVILPIVLTSFSGFNSGEGNVLEWVTASEHNNAYYSVEKMREDGYFEEIGIVDGAGETAFSTSYSFTDDQVLRTTEYYRLQQVNSDGTYTYSSVININAALADEVKLLTGDLAGHYSIEGIADQPRLFCYAIYNASGQLVRRSPVMNLQQHFIEPVSLEGYAGGTYLVEVLLGTTRRTFEVINR
ncbi:MAG: hypothetical protein ABIQ74_04045 [Chitinophagales bacterium]